MAKQFYLEAIGVEADCVEAIYNLGLVNLKMGAYQEALQAFDKLHTIIPHNPEVCLCPGRRMHCLCAASLCGSILLCQL